MKNETNVAVRDTAGALSSNLFEVDANKGSQNIAQDDLALPFLKVLSHLSPEVNKQHAKYGLTSSEEPSMSLSWDKPISDIIVGITSPERFS